MKCFLSLLLLSFYSVTAVYSQSVLKKDFRLSENPGKAAGILSSWDLKPLANTVSVILTQMDTVYTANSSGLSITTDRGASWYNLTGRDGIYKGGIAAMDLNRSRLYVSTIYDTLSGAYGVYGGGGGLSVTTDFGAHWCHIAQPEDTVNRAFDSTGRYSYIIRPNGDTITIVCIRTSVNNLTYDIAVTDSMIWTANFAGGLRSARILPNGDIGYFTINALPSDDMTEVRADSSYNFIVGSVVNGKQVYNHTVFSVLASRTGIWAGTAGGINHSTDNGLSWKRYTQQNSGICGNFVVALAEQLYEENNTPYCNLWAATNKAIASSETDGLSFSADSGRTWRTVLRDVFVNNIAFDGKTVYAATDEGMYRSSDLGLTWEWFYTLVDARNGDQTFSKSFYTVGVQNPGSSRTLYFANLDGLGISTDNGLTWNILRAYPEPGKNSQPKSFAYPNPFSPSIDPAVTRFQFDLEGLNANTDRVTIRIYDFAMDLVATVAKDEPLTKTFFWNGRNNRGKRAANGTYIYTIEAGGKKFWGKVTVRN